MLKMINIKIEKRENGSVCAVSAQGHGNDKVNLAVYTLMEASGTQLETIKSGIKMISEKEMCVISQIKQSKPSVAVVDTLLNGLERLEKLNPYSIQIQYLWVE